jgi:hypothetical protein
VDVPEDLINWGQSVRIISERGIKPTLWADAIADATVPSWHDAVRGVLVRRSDAETWTPLPT